MFVVSKTDIGLVRTENQDRVCVKVLDDDTVIAVVCDGMGGHSLGGEASDIASNAVFDRLSISLRSDADSNTIRNLLLTSISAANTIIYEKSLAEPGRPIMGTTCIAAVVKPNKAYIASVGDSRAYLINDSGIRQITSDHTVVEMLVSQGKLDKDDASSNNIKNFITRAVGAEERVESDYFELDLEGKFVILLCTDGLTNGCADELIYNFVYKKPMEDAVSEMIDYVNKQGGKDNITIALIAD